MLECREEAHLDTGSLEIGDCLGDTVLETIFNGGSSEEDQVTLETVRDGLHLFVTLLDEGRRFVELSLPRIVDLFL